MPVFQTPSKTLALFCKVVDNFGDIGICWRLARQLAHEHGVAVTLWVDDLASFKRICPAVEPDLETQCIQHVTIRLWRAQDGVFSPDEVADIVIEFFACDIPPSYIQAMVQCTPKPVWLNLEGLSAEQWVEGCHQLSSPHPSLSLTKYFYFPGFTDKTGGLLLESDLLQQRQTFQNDAVASTQFLAQLGMSPAEIASLKVSLFCYPHAPVSALFEVWKNSNTPITCLIPEGVAVESVHAFMDVNDSQNTAAGSSATQGALTVRVLPFIPQPEYDKLLWACDVNFVRGEDSFVRAQWANRPFIWHIYPQDNNLHHVKLKAFLQRYSANSASLNTLSLLWNAANSEEVDLTGLWLQLTADLPKINEMSTNWVNEMLANGDLASNLLKFSASVR
jgi:uncharacterized repeat protein (TIGR03837 family)